MAKREYSSALQHLKFMQRAQQREEAAKKAEGEISASDDSHWTVPASATSKAKRCVVIMEGDPKPGALLGRMSFQNCNASVDKLVEDANSALKRTLSAAKERVEVASSSTGEPLREARGAPKVDGDSNDLSKEDVKDYQNKKLKVGSIQDLPIRDRGRGHQTQGSNPWQGWRGQGDYRLLKSPIRR